MDVNYKKKYIIIDHSQMTAGQQENQVNDHAKNGYKIVFFTEEYIVLEKDEDDDGPDEIPFD